MDPSSVAEDPKHLGDRVELQGRALYNVLRISWLEDPKIKVKPWQVEDYRSLSTAYLFHRLKELGIVLEETSFLAYADTCDSPEDLVECLWGEGEEDLDKQEAAYLLLFELWRRLLPHRQSLSIFCDELDRMIELYDQGQLEEESLEDSLKTLENVFDGAADEGEAPEQVFENLSQFCAHDLQGFLYDYISDLIESEEDTYASELLEAFYPFLPDKKWFDLLKAWLFASMDLEELNRVASRLLDQQLDEPDLELLLEIAKFLVHRGDVRLFMQAVRYALPLLGSEEQFQQLLRLIAEYYRCLDKEEEEGFIHHLIHQRSHYDAEKPLDPSDQAFVHIAHLTSH